MTSKEAILFHALGAAQAENAKLTKTIKSQAKIVRDTEAWNAALNKANEKFLRERDLAKEDERDAGELMLAAVDRAEELEAELAARDTQAEDKLAKIHDAVYGHHEYSSILWKVRQIVGPE